MAIHRHCGILVEDCIFKKIQKSLGGELDVGLSLSFAFWVFVKLNKNLSFPKGSFQDTLRRFGGLDNFC